MTDTPLLQGPTLYLRPFEPDDVDALYEYLNYPGLVGRRFIPHQFSSELPLSRKQVAQLIENWEKTERRVHFAIVHWETESVIGHASAFWGWDPHTPDFEIVIAPPHQRKGYGTEILHIFIPWIFNSLPAHNISTWIPDDNKPAHRFVEKHGFHLAGRSRREEFRGGRFVDVRCYDILRPEWEKK